MQYLHKMGSQAQTDLSGKRREENIAQKHGTPGGLTPWILVWLTNERERVLNKDVQSNAGMRVIETARPIFIYRELSQSVSLEDL